MANHVGGTGTLTGPIVRAQAKLRYSTVTPMKARRVVDLVRGLPADEALATLRFAAQSASEPVYKVLESAVANARHQAQLRNERLDVEDLVVSAAYVDEGPTMKRFRPRAQGRAYRIRKRTSHITIHVESWSADTETQANKKSVPRRVKAQARTVAPITPVAVKEAPAKTAGKKAAVKATAGSASETAASGTAASETAAKPAKKTAAKKTAEPKATAAPAAEKSASKAPAAPAKKTAAKKTTQATESSEPTATDADTEGGTR